MQKIYLPSRLYVLKTPIMTFYSRLPTTSPPPPHTHTPSDYFKRNLKDEQVHRILSRLRSSVRQRLKTKEILPYLSKKSVLTDTEIHHLNSSDAQPQEQAIRLVEFFMNKGTYGVATLYLCLMESSEQSGGVPSHYQLAGELKELGRCMK